MSSQLKKPKIKRNNAGDCALKTVVVHSAEGITNSVKNQYSTVVKIRESEVKPPELEPWLYRLPLVCEIRSIVPASYDISSMALAIIVIIKCPLRVRYCTRR